MQFFNLVSFVVVASYAAALPQPAGPSEKYSNNVNTNLASGLEARSYQPGFNSKRDSATLMSLKRRADSVGSSMNLSSTIDNVGDGIANIYKDGEKAGQKIGGTAGDMLVRYFRRHSYVNVALRHWAHESVPGIIEKIKSLWGEVEYPRLEPDLTKKLKQLEDEFRAGLDAIVDATTRILGDDGPVTENIQKIDNSFRLTFSSRIDLLWELLSLMKLFESSKTLMGYLGGISTSVTKFYIEEQTTYGKIISELRAAPSQ
ncbi:hypothetical protein BASA50_004347 [Batrachochytrium salamandrivorans]|uniref:RxLR effector protein n=1 Tax=Batrachochytrium salamandrivorans TaxID=1357716 RepID=A0ABQ8FGN0_9FUNG|nr:hypothetical protein BASA50_004347 [Batrachochytrium salamandrivorans]